MRTPESSGSKQSSASADSADKVISKLKLKSSKDTETVTEPKPKDYVYDLPSKKDVAREHAKEAELRALI